MGPLVSSSSPRPTPPDRHLLDALPGRIAYIDAESRFGWANRAYAEWLGQPSEALAGRHVREVVGEPAFRVIEPYMRRALAGEEVRYETELEYPTRGRRWIEVSYTPYRPDGQAPAGFVVHVTDRTDQRRAELALATSEAEFRAVFELSPSGKAQTDPATGRIVRVNHRFCEITGRTADELLELTLLDLTHPDDRARDGALSARVAHGERAAWTAETRYVRPDGQVVWVLVTGGLVRDAEGRPWRTMSVVNDISELKRSQEELRAINARLRTVLESITEAYLVLDGELRFVEVNPVAERLFGRPAAELIGRRYGDLFPAAVGTDFWREYRAALADGRERHVEAWSPVTERWLEAHAYPRHGRLEVYFRDVTERRRAEEAVRRSEERLRRITNAVPAIVWTSDARGLVTYFNERWTELTGLSLADSLGDGFVAAIHPDDRARTTDAWEASLRTGRPYENECRYVMADGSARWFLTRAEPLLAPDGAVEGWIGTSADIEDKRRLEASLREADRRKDEFLAMLAHELRNPLAPIRTAVELLRLRDGTSPTATRAREVIDRQAQHLTRLVDDLLEVSRVTTGKIRIELEPVDGRNVLARAIETTQPAIEARRQRLAVATPERPVVVRADATRLAQVLGNLLHNAAKYTPVGGAIEVALAAVGEQAVFRVSDSGLGIPTDMLEQIFEPFTQIDRSLDRSQGGLGIGLTLARRLVELHGGTIRATSSGVAGQGSTFTVTLPIVAATVADAPDATAGEGQRAGLRVLVVDDNRDAADTLGELLVTLGHDAVVVHDGPAALTAAADEAPDLVLLDIGLPGLTGYDVARSLRQRHGAAVTIVALTGYGQEEDRRRAREAGFDQHLIKPLDLGALDRLLTDLVVRSTSTSPPLRR